ncbi:hypothetical protein, partial [Bradyrhizobium sp. 39]|uniref:hypothetical protein n=2 Tax=unclassified Bradyrhizobium TaxID=2631580 RepID=UPI001FF8505E
RKMTDLDELRKATLLAEKFWGRMFGGFLATTYQDKGETAYLDTYFQTLRSHQNVKFLEGLKKLGVREDEPPAVKACKYHYFSNILGGLKLQYIEESPKKCWIRYLAPRATFTGLAILAVPAHTAKTVAHSWHPRNGELLGCDRLQYVRTKNMMEGDPYDEAYWVELDRPVAPEERLIFRPEIRTPEFDPAKAPQLDPKLWPEGRRLKARANYSAGYVSRTTSVLVSKFGVEAAADIVGRTMRGLAIQHINELKADQGIEGADLHSVVQFFAGILTACRQEFQIEKVSPTKTRIVLKSYKPFDWEVPEKLRDAFFEYQRIAVRIMNGRVKLFRSVAPEFGATEAETWEFEDTGRWLW